jgi:hypothetical protein
MFFYERRSNTFPVKFPCCHVGIIFIVAEGFSLICLMLYTEMTPTGFLSMESVAAKKLTKLQKIRYAASFFQGLIKPLPSTENVSIPPEFFADLSYLLECPLQAFAAALHAAVVP